MQHSELACCQLSPLHSDDCLKDQISQTHDCSELPQFQIEFANPSQSLVDQMECLLLKYMAKDAFGLIWELGKRRNRESKNLALKLAQRMPKTIRNEMVGIVRYYEGHMSDQLQQIHELVSKNHILRKQVIEANDKLSQKHSSPTSNKQNNFTNKSSVTYGLGSDPSKDERIEELESFLMDKNRTITELNKQITELYARAKKYKKRVCELEAKSPIKHSTMSLESKSADLDCQNDCSN